MNEAKARYNSLKADPNADPVALKAAKKLYKALKKARESTTSIVGTKRPRTTSGGEDTKDTNKTSEAKVAATNTTINEESAKKPKKKPKLKWMSIWIQKTLIRLGSESL